jgi:hypothetical protein
MFERVINGITIDMPRDLEGVVADSAKFKKLKPVGKPIILEAHTLDHSRGEGYGKLELDQIPNGATAYCHGPTIRLTKITRADYSLIPIQFYKNK